VAAGAGRKEPTVLDGRNRRCGRGESAPHGSGGAWGWGFVTPSGAAFGPPRGEALGRRPAGGSGPAAWGGRAGGLRGGTRSGGLRGGTPSGVSGRPSRGGVGTTAPAGPRWRGGGARQDQGERPARRIRFRVSGGNWPAGYPFDPVGQASAGE